MLTLLCLQEAFRGIPVFQSDWYGWHFTVVSRTLSAPVFIVFRSWSATVPRLTLLAVCVFCAAQVWFRLAHVQGLRRVPGRLPVRAVHAGHRHRRLPASAPHRRQRRELQSVKLLLGDPKQGMGPHRGLPHQGSWHELQDLVIAYTQYFVRNLLNSPTHDFFFFFFAF